MPVKYNYSTLYVIRTQKLLAGVFSPILQCDMAMLLREKIHYITFLCIEILTPQHLNV